MKIGKKYDKIKEGTYYEKVRYLSHSRRIFNKRIGVEKNPDKRDLFHGAEDRSLFKKETDEILNTMANALSQSAGNGNEWVWVQLVIQYGDHNKSVFCLQEEPVVRFNLEYHELVDRTRKLEAILKKEIGMIL